MGKFDKYKKEGSSKLEKYKKSHGSTIKEAEKASLSSIKKKSTSPLARKKKELREKQASSSAGTAIIVVLGILTVAVWVGVFIKLFS